MDADEQNSKIAMWWNENGYSDLVRPKQRLFDLNKIDGTKCALKNSSIPFLNVPSLYKRANTNSRITYVHKTILDIFLYVCVCAGYAIATVHRSS